jgi:hypothetical protein
MADGRFAGANAGCRDWQTDLPVYYCEAKAPWEGAILGIWREWEKKEKMMRKSEQQRKASEKKQQQGDKKKSDDRKG